MNIWLAAAVTGFVILLMFPLVASLLSYRTRGTKPLFIDQKHHRSPRYFSQSFSRKFDKSWQEYDGSGKLYLSHTEDIIEADYVSEYPENCQAVVYAQSKEFMPPAGTTFEKEIYARHNARLLDIPFVRAVCCKGDLILGSDTQIGRWADADGSVAVYDGCDLGISASSASRLVIGNDCHFHRLYAPEICLGQYPGEEREPARDVAEVPYNVSAELLRDVEYVEERYADKRGTVEYSVISRHSVTVVEGMVLEGDIRSHKGVRLCDGAVVCGNIFAEQDILLGRGSFVLGTVFTQESIHAERDVQIGRRGRICSVIARGSITFEEGCRVYGYVSSEEGGFTCLSCDAERDMQENEDVESPERETRYADRMLPRESVAFASAAEYEAVDPLSFRSDASICRAVLPKGISKVHDSLFYGCAGLKEIDIPESLTEIGGYAFCGCASLERIDLSGCSALARIGESAFCGCTSLKEILLPASLEELACGAFGDCTALCSVDISGSALKEIGSHAFCGCSALREAVLPAGLESLGMSAFYGCTSLFTLELPPSLKEVGRFAFEGCTALPMLHPPEGMAQEQLVNLPGYVKEAEHE